MSGAEQQSQSQAETTLLDDVFAGMGVAGDGNEERRDETKHQVDAFVKLALDGTLTIDKSLGRSIDNAIELIDEKLSTQLSAILHHERLQKLEGSWRGLLHLVTNTVCLSGTLELKVLHVPKKELARQFERAKSFDTSTFFRKIYTQTYDMFGADPFGVLIGDYEFSNHPDDINLLREMAGVCAAAWCPFISAASAKHFELDDFTQLPKPNQLKRTFDKPSYAGWRSFRDSEDSRFVALTMPRVLSRLPYGAMTKPIDEFNFEEVQLDDDGNAVEVPHEKFTWMNSAYAMGARMTDAFFETSWCTAIRGIQNGGVVQNLPVFTFKSDEGDEEMKCPTECGIPGRREHELSNLGFLPLCHWQNEDYSAFLGGQTCQKPAEYMTDDATANSKISARLPYIMAASRISHYLAAMARDWIGGNYERGDLHTALNTWINQYVLDDPNSTADERVRFPLRAAQIEVEEIPDSPGAYRAVAHLRPWLQLEELHASVRMVANLPKPAGS